MSVTDFDTFCQETYPSVERLALFITGDRSDAQEVAQETFARTFSHWRKVSRLTSPEAWTHRVAANLAISTARRARVRRAFVPDRPRIVDGPEPSDSELMEAIGELSPAQRAVVVLRFMEDLSIEQVASRLDKAPGTVRALTAQAMARLRSRLRQEEIVHDGE
jgi:RNA polymerase sigma-70 factor (sigma-E family)